MSELNDWEPQGTRPANADDLDTGPGGPRIGTLSPYDFAHWASTRALVGPVSDVRVPGVTFDGAELVAWAAEQVGSRGLPTTLSGLVTLLTQVDPDEVIGARGYLLVGSGKVAVTLGFGTAVVASGSQYLIVDTQAGDWSYGAAVPGLRY